MNSVVLVALRFLFSPFLLLQRLGKGLWRESIHVSAWVIGGPQGMINSLTIEGKKLQEKLDEMNIQR